MKWIIRIIKEQAEKWKSQIDIRACNALMDYQVEITDWGEIIMGMYSEIYVKAVLKKDGDNTFIGYSLYEEDDEPKLYYV